MSKIFAERGMRADGNVLPFEEFRLFLDEKDPKFNDEKMAKTVKEAEKYLETPIPLLPASLYREFSVNGNRSRFEAVYFRRRGMALSLALAEAYEKKGRFTEKLMDVVWAIMEETSWVIPAHLYNHPLYCEFKIPAIWGDRMHGIDLFSAMTGAVLTVVYHYCSEALDALSPAVSERLEYEIRNRIIRPYLHCTFWWTGERGNKTNNWNPWIHSNILLATALVVKDPYERTAMVKKCMAGLDNFVNFYPPDGGCDEGPGYFNCAGAAYFDCLELLYDLTGGKVDVFDHPLVRNIGEYIVKFNINGVRVINFADCGPNAHSDGDMLTRFGRKCGSRILEEFGYEQAYLGAVHDGWLLYRGLRSYLWAPVKEPKERFAATKIWFPDLKVMVARENTDPSKGLFVAMKGGNNDEMHNHNDVGNVIVYYGGNPVLIDTGAGTYTKQTFSSRRYELWFMQSSYHNVAEIGGAAQKNGAQFRSRNEEYNEATGGVKMELAGAYLPDAGVKSYTRETVLDKGTLRVTDSFSLDGEKEIDIHFIAAAKPELDGDTILLPEGRKMTFDKGLTPEIEEFAVNDDGIVAKWHTEVLWRIHLRAVTKDGSYTVTVR